jgi:diacylglycerol kinase (ATP)
MSHEWCIIYNPHSGKGRAARRLEAIRQSWPERIELWPTQHGGHAEELALAAANQGFRLVGAAGGDGTVHEVANGLLRAAREDVTFAVLPIGSANDYANSLELADGFGEARSRLVDVGLIRDAAGRQRHFVCCLGLGFNGLVTVESRRIRWLQGVALYGLATLRVLWRWHDCPLMTIEIDGQPATPLATLMLSVLVGRREGGFVMAPACKLDDGEFDYVRAGDLSRLEIIRLLPRLAVFGPPHNHPKVQLGRCRRIALRSSTPLAIHTDGEFFCRPEDEVTHVEIVVRPLALRVQLGLPPNG